MSKKTEEFETQLLSVRPSVRPLVRSIEERVRLREAELKELETELQRLKNAILLGRRDGGNGLPQSNDPSFLKFMWRSLKFVITDLGIGSSLVKSVPGMTLLRIADFFFSSKSDLYV